MTLKQTAIGLILSALLCVCSLNELKSAESKPLSDFTVEEKTKTHWFDIKNLGVEGKGWTETESAKAKGVVRPPVWSLSKHSAGLAVRFVTDATTIKAKWKLTSANIAMNHMAATGVSGLDLYVKTESGKWRWLAVGKPSKQENNETLISGLIPGKREYILYLPLYNGVESVEIGVPETSHLWKAPPRETGKDKPLVFWGTSITQGGCASRTGMVHTAILGRRLDLPVINLGFSGNGRMEPEVAKLVAELDASVFIMDCLPKMSSQDRHRTSREALKKAYDKLKQEGVKNLYYLDGETLLGDDSEDTVDSSHPTDLGFFRQADAFEKVLRPILEQQSK